MRFEHKRGITRKKSTSSKVGSFVITLIALAGLLGGGYLLLLVLTPNIPVLYPIVKIDSKKLSEPKEDKIYIPKIGVEVALNKGGAEALDSGAWHRFPERGDPTKDGNFIVSGHRFEIGLTPGQTRRRSPFYHIQKLAVGDKILVDFQGKRYGYEVYEHKSVKPNQIEIESPISKEDNARMTLYTCTLKGQSDGREVIFAKPLGEVKNGEVE